MTNQIQTLISIINEAEKKNQLKQPPLTYSKTDLSPVLSKDAMDYHYGKLYKTYVDRYNSNEGDPDFNLAGATLHSIFFSQFKPPAGSNKPSGKTIEFIEKNFKSWEEFKTLFEKEAMSIQGSGWVYLSTNGKIKTIKNHQVKNDVVILVDWWEHAWALDYQADKAKYLKNIWRIIDWEVINILLS